MWLPSAAAMPRKVGWSARGVRSPLGRPKAAEAMALPWLPNEPAHMAPSMRWKAISRPPASHTAIFILAPIWFAFSVAPAITRLASARVRVMRSILSGQELTRMLAPVDLSFGAANGFFKARCTNWCGDVLVIVGERVARPRVPDLGGCRAAVAAIDSNRSP